EIAAAEDAEAMGVAFREQDAPVARDREAERRRKRARRAGNVLAREPRGSRARERRQHAVREVDLPETVVLLVREVEDAAGDRYARGPLPPHRGRAAVTAEAAPAGPRHGRDDAALDLADPLVRLVADEDHVGGADGDARREVERRDARGT